MFKSLFQNKRAISEITSFTLLTLVIVISSIAAYSFSNSFIDEKIISYDLKNMESNFMKLNLKFSQVQSFDESQTIFFLSFKKGELKFNSNKLSYQSLVEDNSNSVWCESGICTNSTSGFEEISLNLSNSYTFSENFSLVPGNYNLIITNIKNESKIKVSLFE